MSLSSVTKVKCPDCNHEQEIEIYQSLNVSLDPELKEKLINGDLTTFNCQKCRYETHFPINLLYNDMDEQILIYWLQSEEDTNAFLESQKKYSDNILHQMYKKRIVFSLGELVEKIAIFDADLNDKVIECCKMVLKDSAQDTGNHIEFMFYECKEKKENNRVLIFPIFTENFEYIEKVAEIPFSLYKQFINDIMKYDPKILEENGDWMHVNGKMMLQSYREFLDRNSA